MPNIRSAKKRLKQNDIRRQRNLQTQSAYQKSMKKIRKLLDKESVSEASSLLPITYKLIDIAAKKRVISKAKAGRKKSHVAALLKKHGAKMPTVSKKTATKPKSSTTAKKEDKKTAVKTASKKKTTKKAS